MPHHPIRQKIAVLVTGDPVPLVREHRGSFFDLIVQTVGPAPRIAFDPIDARSGTLPHGKGHAALIITGSPHSVHAREPWMLAAASWVRRTLEAGIPTLGICFGHQLLAYALGGEVLPNPRGRDIGTAEIHRLTSDPIFGNLELTFSANVCHRDTVTRLPAGADVLASSALDSHQCVRYAKDCYGLQFHPEFDGDVTRRYIQSFRSEIEREGLDAESILGGTRDTPESASILSTFVDRIVRDSALLR